MDGENPGTEYLGDVRLLFPKLYLKAYDLRGQEVTLTIDHVEVVAMRMKDGSTEKQPVLFFRETRAKAEKAGNPSKEKRFVLSAKCNRDAIGEMYGYEASAWKGKKITFYSIREMAFGKMQDCLRIRNKVPRNGTAEIGDDEE